MRSTFSATTLLITACNPEWPASRPAPQPAPPELELLVEPDDRGSAVVRLTLEGEGSWSVPPADVALFDGALTDTQLDRWVEDDLTDSLRERLVPCTVYATEDGALRAVPHRALRLGAEHVVASRADGKQLSFWTAESGPTPATRVFPPAEAEARGTTFVFCADAPGDAAPGATPRQVTLEPSAAVATVATLALDPRCVLLEAPSGDGALAHPPRTAFGLDLDPAPLRLTAAADEAPPPTCAAEELVLARACARVEDDRLVVGPSTETTLFVFAQAGESARRLGTPDRGFEWRGLSPGTSQELKYAAVTAAGVETFEAWLTTPPAQPRLEISEVLANPEGPEPAQEWIELVNEGSVAADTTGVALFDAAGSVLLPGIHLLPGARVLLVRDDFDPSAEPTSLGERALVRLPSLGGNGLSNEGEELSLRRDGIVLSEAPAKPKPASGASLGRGEDPVTGEVVWRVGSPTPLAENEGVD